MERFCGYGHFLRSVGFYPDWVADSGKKILKNGFGRIFIAINRGIQKCDNGLKWVKVLLVTHRHDPTETGYILLIFVSMSTSMIYFSL